MKWHDWFFSIVGFIIVHQQLKKTREAGEAKNGWLFFFHLGGLLIGTLVFAGNFNP